MEQINEFRKIEIFKELCGSNSIDVKLNGEGHTAASVITERLVDMTEFAAYKIAHPTDSFVTIRIKTNENPIATFKKCVKSIVYDLNDLMEQVKNGC
ncbi:hypothetical protein EHP00_1645 [Ecytonucleospora hepatopenaei]|uniref:DNA-directed RNA polymerase RBP11-like dimerisation domain-containing protein n=1 Tax=Ecytonucleospora hepatopenaei TaxID=646526 RepID=A0A1W0E970_9MICR|nr:hypothetical protein EHP00_1645 [Ecytonucleospora hepatopenaei]